ncbi:protein MCM10 homolog isoform X2 [Artemia franciscana]|uniref:protein MCM10 homolog isoform X2 n=1 Tax=Artemia franciscana TaxID=6661 RepID=UPI0032DA5D35
MANEECDIDTLLSLIDDDDAEESNETEKATSELEETQESETGALEAKLKAMQEEMEKLQKALKSKKQGISEINLFQKNANKPDNCNQSLLLPQSGRTAKIIDSGSLTPSIVKKELSNKEKENILKSLKQPSSEIHSGDTDSSDDEERRNHESKYNEYGKELKKLQKKYEQPDRLKGVGVGQGWKDSASPVVKLGFNKEEKSLVNMYTCRYSGIRILNPVISKSFVEERMEGKKMVRMSSLEIFIRCGDTSMDWVTMGVVISKSESKVSQKGNAYSLWRVCDLTDCSKIITLFLFSNAQKDLWKTAVGTVIGLLNPSILKDRESGKEKSNLSIDTATKVMLLGVSADFGVCKGTNKKDGRSCANVVNKSTCEYCVYHVQAEYKKTASKRSDIQSTFSSPNGLRNKVLGKSEVFYAGKSFSAIKEEKTKTDNPNLKLSLESLKKTNDLKRKDDELLALLNGGNKNYSQISNFKPPVERKLSEVINLPTPGARNLLHCLTKKEETTKETQKSMGSAKNFLSQQLNLKESRSPKVGRDLGRDSFLEFDLSKSKVALPSDLAKFKAIEILKKNGSAAKSDPNAICKVDVVKRQEIVKRKLDGSSLEIKGPQEIVKRSKLDSLRSVELEKIKNATSSHADLIEQLEDEEQEKYFSKLEKKEQLEKKMEETFEVKTKAVHCKQCKYTAFTAAGRCRNELHPLKVIFNG